MSQVRESGSGCDTADTIVVTSDFSFDAHGAGRDKKQMKQFYKDCKKGRIHPVSGLVNRIGFEPALIRYLKEEQLQNYTGWVVYFDVDGLKEMNDNYGHVAGDGLLKAAGVVLKKMDGVAAHISGDEFVAFIPKYRSHKGSRKDRLFSRGSKSDDNVHRSYEQSDLEGLYRRLNREFDDSFISFVTPDGEPIREFKISISMGAVPVSGIGFDDVISAMRQADDLMQVNKQARKAQRVQLQKQRLIDESSGKIAFLELINNGGNTPEVNRIKELIAELGIVDGTIPGSFDPRVTELSECLNEGGYYDANRYVGSIVFGVEIYPKEVMTLKGLESIGLRR